jgi:hypothetical protein
MPEGVIVGGWSFVVAAYVLVGGGLVLYSIHLITRLVAVRRQLARESRDAGAFSEAGASRAPIGPGEPEDARRSTPGGAHR